MTALFGQLLPCDEDVSTQLWLAFCAQHEASHFQCWAELAITTKVLGWPERMKGWSSDLNYRRLSAVLSSRGDFLRDDFIKQMDDKWQSIILHSFIHFIFFDVLYMLSYSFKPGLWGPASSLDKSPAVWEIAHGYWQGMTSTWLLQNWTTVAVMGAAGDSGGKWL